MPILPIRQKGCVYIFNSDRKLPAVWTNAKCFDLLDHMLYLSEQGSPPFYIALCCGLDKMIEKQPYDYDGIRRWIAFHYDFVEKVWGTVCIPVNHVV